MDMMRQPNWLELPQCIVEFILNKLHYVDQIRALAVCKTWRDCKDHVRCLDRLPWVISHQVDHKIKGNKYSFLCELFDPYSQMAVTEFSMSVTDRVLHVLASKFGWLFLCDMYNTHLLHNPFANVMVRLPLDLDLANRQVTMKCDPQSMECEVFISSMDDDGYFRIRSYRISKDDDYDGYVLDDGTSGVKDMNVDDETLLSMSYMDGSIYILLESSLHMYVLENKKFKLLTTGFPEPYESLDSMRDGWLLEINKNLMIVRMDFEDELLKWMIFRFDWSNMSWVVENSLRGCAIFISGNVAFSAPLTTNSSSGEILEDCRLFYLDEFDDVSGGKVFKCYAFSDAGWMEMESNEYEWIKRSDRCELGFIEPPYFKN